MSHPEIIAELPKLTPEQRQDVLNHLWKLQERDLLAGKGPTEDEKKLLDAESEQFERDKDFGQPWQEVLREIWPAGGR